MKLKCTNVLVTIAMICSVLAMIMNWIIYFGPQDKYVQSFGVDVNTERIFDIRCIICPILNNMRNFMEKPFHILAMIFLAITIGTLCGRDNNMQQTPYYGDPMYQMPNNGYNTQPQSGQSL